MNLENLIHISYFEIVKNGFISKENGARLNPPRKSTAQVVNTTAENYGNTPVSASQNSKDFLAEMILHYSGGSFNNSILEDKNRQIVNKYYQKKTNVAASDIGAVVYLVNRFMKFKENKTLTMQSLNSQFLGQEGGQKTNFFIKISDILNQKEYNFIYFRFRDRNGNIGAFYQKKEEPFISIKVNDCLGISANVRKHKLNKYTYCKETIFSEVEVIKNYGQK